jgi:dCMP deaminase
MGSTAISEALQPPAVGRRPWANHFIDIAQLISTRSTCDRLRVGAVFVRDNRILCTGYNGSLPGRQHCDDVGHLMHEGHCHRAVHAEQNAIAQAAQHGVSLTDSWLFVTHLPCIVCFKIVLAAGCARVYYGEQYGTADMSLYHGLQGMSRLEQVR